MLLICKCVFGKPGNEHDLHTPFLTERSLKQLNAALPQNPKSKTGTSLTKLNNPLIYSKTHRTQQDASLTPGELLKHLCPLLFAKRHTRAT